jgi:predicted ATP-grasp superfamily ATP-dependent carboligase
VARILVTDGEARSALAVVRSLGRAGHEVLVAGGPDALASHSRWSRRSIVVPDPVREPHGFGDALIAATHREELSMIIPVTDGSCAAILPRAEEFRPALIPAGTAEAFGRVSDKASTAQVAARLGIRVPAQRILASKPNVPTPDFDTIFPAVVKPSRSVVGNDGGRTKLSVLHAADASSLQAALDRLPAAAYPVLIQERIVGPGVGVFLCRWRGTIVASFAHRRIREKPPAGGVSVYAESIAVTDSVMRHSEQLIEALDWEGVAMVEYKIDAASGEPYLMEINGRFWGTLQLAIDAGVDFPRLLVDSALGKSVPPVRRWKLGQKSRWFWGDMDHLLTVLRRSPADLHLPPGAPGRLKTLVAEIGTTLRIPADQVFRVADPGPGLAETWARARGRRRSAESFSRAT